MDADAGLHGPEARVFERQRMMAVRKAVAALSPRQRVVIAARFGLDDGWPQTLDATAATLGKVDGYTLGRERIRQIEAKALRHLRAHGGLGDVAPTPKPKPKFDPAAFLRHQQALQARLEAQAQWEAEREARMAEARRQAMQPQPPRPPQVVTPLPTPVDTWRGAPTYHYDWMEPRNWPAAPPAVIVSPDTIARHPSFHYDYLYDNHPFSRMKR